MYVAVKADLSHLSICTLIIFTLTRDAGIRQIHRKICKIYVRRDLQDVSKANMSNQLTRFLGKIPIRSVANERHFLFFKSRTLHPASDILKHLKKEVKHFGCVDYFCLTFTFALSVGFGSLMPDPAVGANSLRNVFQSQGIDVKFRPRVDNAWKYFDILAQGI